MRESPHSLDGSAMLLIVRKYEAPETAVETFRPGARGPLARNASVSLVVAI